MGHTSLKTTKGKTVLSEARLILAKIKCSGFFFFPLSNENLQSELAPVGEPGALSVHPGSTVSAGSLGILL